MEYSVPSLRKRRLPLFRLFGVLLAVVLVAVLVGAVAPAPAQAAVSYSSEEIAFLKSINDYRAAHGLSTLMVSDSISEACDRHSSDMGKYRFFDHYTKGSDWFKVGASPWDRMAASGYSYNTYKAENIAAGSSYSTAAGVFAAWKNSSGHNANMLGANYRVIGISLTYVSGSPYGYYWTTDFGGYVDPTAHTLTSAGSRYQQTDPRIAYTGTWGTYSTGGASGGSFKYSNSSNASINVKFTGTYLSWIGVKSPIYGKARVTVDNGAAQEVDLYSSTPVMNRSVWNTGSLAAGTHTVRIEWTGYQNESASDTYIGSDAFDVIGTLSQATAVASASSTLTTFQETDSRLIYTGSWSTYRMPQASGGSYRYSNSSDASVTVKFTGSYLKWVGVKAPMYGKAKITLDNGTAQYLDLYSATPALNQSLWNTGTLTSGSHTVKIEWAGQGNTAATDTFIGSDAFQVIGTLN